jgi:thioredoxin-related protein
VKVEDLLNKIIDGLNSIDSNISWVALGVFILSISTCSFCNDFKKIDNISQELKEIKIILKDLK